MRRLITSLALVSVFSFSQLGFAAKDEVNIYSARKEALIKPLLDRFSELNGIKVNLVTGKGDALLTRLKNEGSRSPADLLITSDVGRLHRAKQADVLQAVELPKTVSTIASKYRDSENFWYGLSLRSRVIVYAPDRVKASELSSYEALAEPAWAKRVCIRSSSNVYNQSLVASFIEHHGMEKTEAWLKKFVANFARPPRGGDRDQIKAVAAGQCDVAVVNSYYLGNMLASSDESQRAIAQSVKLFWPNQNGRGAHMNVSGVGITKSAKNKENAIKLINFLITEQSQNWYASVNYEFPVREDVKPRQILAEWGDFKADALNVEKLGQLNAEAVKAMDRSGWK